MITEAENEGTNHQQKRTSFMRQDRHSTKRQSSSKKLVANHKNIQNMLFNSNNDNNIMIDEDSQHLNIEYDDEEFYQDQDNDGYQEGDGDQYDYDDDEEIDDYNGDNFESATKMQPHQRHISSDQETSPEKKYQKQMQKFHMKK